MHPANLKIAFKIRPNESIAEIQKMLLAKLRPKHESKYSGAISLAQNSQHWKRKNGVILT